MNSSIERSRNIPQLRFPEFKGEWEKKKLGELLEFKNGINASKEQYGSGYKFINVLDILNNDFITHNNIIGSVNVDEETVNKYPVNYGDILFQRSSETREEVGSASVYLDKDNTATFGGFVIRGRKIGDYEPVFLNKLLKTDLSRDQITSKSGGSTRYNVGQEILSSVELFFPTLPEQTKIASFLTAVDEKIQALKKKHSLLEQYKKGVMQKLFSQELRFKPAPNETSGDENGEGFPEWEVKKLGEVCNVIIGGTPNTTNEKFWNGNIGWIGSGELKNGIITKPTKYITELGLKKSSTYLMPRNTTVLAMTGATLGKIGYLDFDCAGNQSVAGFINLQNLNSKFLFFQLQVITNQILSLAGGAAQSGINKSNIESLIISSPCIEEQTAIANFLSAIDEKIHHTQTQIEKTEAWKKGLLQKMFV